MSSNQKTPSRRRVGKCIHSMAATITVTSGLSATSTSSMKTGDFPWNMPSPTLDSTDHPAASALPDHSTRSPHRSPSPDHSAASPDHSTCSPYRSSSPDYPATSSDHSTCSLPPLPPQSLDSSLSSSIELVQGLPSDIYLFWPEWSARRRISGLRHWILDVEWQEG